MGVLGYKIREIVYNLYFYLEDEQQKKINMQRSGMFSHIMFGKLQQIANI